MDTVRTAVNIYRQRLPTFAERITTEVADGLCGFFFEFLNEAHKLIEKQRNTIELIVKTNFEAVHAFLSSSESVLSRSKSFS